MVSVAGAIDALIRKPIRLAERSALADSGRQVLQQITRDLSSAKVITDIADAGNLQRIELTIPEGWTGYTGRAEAVVKDVCKAQGLTPDQTVVYLCGNPEMIINVELVLMDCEYPEFHVKKELYWPKGKKPTT